MSDRAVALAQKAAEALANHRTHEVNPFLLLPAAEWIDPVCKFTVLKAHLFRGGLVSLCANLSYWHKKGLTLAGAVWVLDRLSGPDAMARHRADWDLFTELGALTMQAIRNDRAAEEARLRREARVIPAEERQKVRSELATMILKVRDEALRPVPRGYDRRSAAQVLHDAKARPE